MNSSYQEDFFGWAQSQAALLRAGRLDIADIENIAEEIESMGRSEKRELVSRLSILMLHLLKWQAQPGGRGTSWRLTIIEQRRRLELHLADNPSFKPLLEEAVANAYGLAALRAARETGLDMDGFPRVCPWTPTQMSSPDFWPD